MRQQTGRVAGAKKGANTRKVQVPRGGLQPGSKYEKFDGTTPSLVPARAANDRTTSRVAQPGGMKDPTANVKPSEQKQQEAEEEDPSALNESESRVSASSVAAASKALSISPPVVWSYVCTVLIAFIYSPHSHDMIFDRASAARPKQPCAPGLICGAWGARRGSGYIGY